MSILKLIWTFFYIGAFTIGGGQVAISLMYEPFVDSGIITAEQFYNMVAISESTPGPIGINMATYIGYELYGVPGGILVTAATVLPSLIIILVIAGFFDRYRDTALVKSVFSCVRPVAAALIGMAGWNVLNISLVKTFSAARLCIFIFLLVLVFLDVILKAAGKKKNAVSAEASVSGSAENAGITEDAGTDSAENAGNSAEANEENSAKCGKVSILKKISLYIRKNKVPPMLLMIAGAAAGILFL